MTNRLLVRSETKQTKQETVRGGSRLLVLGILGLIGLAGLGLLAVPILIGTNAFFAATAGCSGDQNDRAARRRQQGQVDPG
jgi:hypothetical protein